MRVHPVLRGLAAGLVALGLASSQAGADLVKYSWSGRVEPASGAANPWGLLGDGSAVTPDDGTSFTIEGLVDTTAVDEDGMLNPGVAIFAPESATLDVGGHVASLMSPEFEFFDDQFGGAFDSMEFQAEAEIFGTSMTFVAEVRLPATTFALADPAAPDSPPSFADTMPIQFGGAAVGDLITLPQDATVTALLELCDGGPTPVTWTTPTEGTADGVDVSVANLGMPSLSTLEMRGSDFAAAELCSNAGSLEYETGSDWTVTLSQPVAALLVYARFWRGPAADIDPVTYQFDAPFTILSGLAAASVANGDTLLSAPGPGFHDGILRFEGPISSLSVGTNSMTTSEQAMTFAVVPEPAAAAGAPCALAAILWLRRRRTPGA